MSTPASPPSSKPAGNKVPDVSADNQQQPARLPANAALSNADSNPSSNSAFAQRPFSPLTLDELGLHPPATPSALLDITTPVSLAMSADSMPAPEPSSNPLDIEQSSRSRRTNEATLGGVNDVAAINKQNTDCALIRVADPPTSVDSPASYHDPFLNSFLQSLGEDPLTSENTSSVELDEAASSTARVPIPVSSAPQLSTSTTNVPDPRASAALRPVGRPVILSSLDASSNIDTEKGLAAVASTAPHLLTQGLASDFHQLFQATASAANHTSSYWAAPQPPCSNGQSFPAQSITTHSRSASSSAVQGSSSSHRDDSIPSWASFLPFGSDNFLVTPTPLERAPTSAPSSTEAKGSVKAASTAPAPSSGGLPKSKWPFDLTNLSHFSLPQAPPLQPEHRYPISILESDGHYEPDPETDRESEAGQRVELSPSRNNSSGVASKPATSASASSKRKSLGLIQREDGPFSTDISRPASRGAAVQEKVTSSATSAFQMRGTPAPGTRVTSGTIENPLKIVPLFNVVRSRSWSTASHSSSGGHEAAPWLASSDGASQAESLARRGSSGEPVASEQVKVNQTERKKASSSSLAQLPCSSTSKSSSSIFGAPTGTSPDRTTSHDFTRQALLDYIRRTNLGMASNTSSGGSETQSSSKNIATSTESAIGLEAPAKMSLASSSTWSSTVPAELQARLQSWQHQRKRQRLQSEASAQDTREQTPSQSSKLPSGATGRSSPGHTSSSFDQVEQQQARSTKRSGAESDQEQKSRKQEHYQRLLLQLQAQMRIKMQMQMQKQKEMQEKMKRRDSLERKDDPDKENEFRQPSPPSKPSIALKAGREGVRATIGGKDTSAVHESTMRGDEIPASSKASPSSSYQTKEDGTKKSRSISGSKLKVCSPIDGSTRPSSITIPVSTPAETPRQTIPDLPASTWWEGPVSTSIDILPGVPVWPSSQQYGLSSWQTVSAGRYGHQSASAAVSWQGQPSWYSGPGGAERTIQPAPMWATKVWSNVAESAPPNSWNSTSSTIELMLRHPNWLRDPPALFPMSPFPSSTVGSLTTPHYVDTSSFAISTAALSMPSTSTSSQTALVDRPLRLRETDQPGIRRPFSPGEEVVFWAVKGEHSVKLVGTVDSMTDRWANIVVPSKIGRSQGPEQVISASPRLIDGSSHHDALQADSTSSECYRHVSFANILAKDQAIVLGFV